MPIYAYKCGSCGHAKDILRRLSDEPLTVCPACGAATFSKQVTAAGFQLKGSGWYATDFKGGPTGAPADGAKGEGAKGEGEGKPADAAKSGEAAAKPAESGASPAKADAPAAAPAPAPAPPSK